jgi:OFA family oxalate/formate antiporter-like MFS transporter
MSMNNRWFQLCASVLAMVMIANLQYAWTLFVEPIRQGTGWKLSDIQWAFTLFILFQTWVQPLQGWLVDRTGPRAFISVAGVLCGAGWAGLALVRTLPQLYVVYSVAGVGAAFVYSASMASALKWFGARRGLASGIMAAGFASGASLFIPLIAYTIRTDGHRAAFIWTGAVQGLVILVVAQFLRLPPRELAAGPAVPAARASSRLGRHEFTTTEMLRAPQFYVLYLMFVLMTIGGLLVTAQAGPIARAWNLSASALALATTIGPLANGAGRVFWGQVSDRIGRETTMLIAFSLQAVCLTMVLTIGRHSGGGFAITLALTYFTWGEIYALFPAALADYFGTRHATSNNSVLYTAKGVASIVAGWLAARLYERSGTWTPAFYGSAAMALTAAILALGLRTAMMSLKPGVRSAVGDAT